MVNSKKRPLGVELLSRGLITENDIDTVISYQKEHPKVKTAEIFYILGICPAKQLLDILAETTGDKTVYLTKNTVKVTMSKYLPIEYIREKKVVPFDLDGKTIKLAMTNIEDAKLTDDLTIKMKELKLKPDFYVTFESLITNIVDGKEISNAKQIELKGDISKTVDAIIKDAMSKRASDIHFEPYDKGMRIRIRIDGELIVYGIMADQYKNQVTGRLKAISNMFQEKQESQDGRITSYPDYNIRVSSQKNIYGEKIVLRLLKKNANIMGLGELGYPTDDDFMNRYFKQVNGMTILTAPTGEGKTTTLYSVINKLNDQAINITTIEDPVEIRIEGLNQIEITDNISFSDSLRTVLRQDPEIILVGEIRDEETAQMAVSSAHTGHYVLTTLHTISAVEAITRLRKLGLSDYDIGGTVNTIVSQRLVRRLCTCAKPRPFTKDELSIIEKFGKKYKKEFLTQGVKTYSPVGCEKCMGTGFYDRIAIYEILEVDDDVRDLINRGESTMKIREILIEHGYEPIQIDAINKILNGTTCFSEVQKKIQFKI